MKNYKPAANQQTDFNLFVNRHSLLQFLCLAAVFGGFVLGGCDFSQVDAAAQKTSKEESNMESIQSTTTIQHIIPPIDAAVIPEIATATFAMG